MTIPTEVAAVLAEMHAHPEPAGHRALQTWADRIESALTKAEAVEPVAWFKHVVTPGGPYSPEEHDVALDWGLNPPDSAGGWSPLYTSAMLASDSMREALIWYAEQVATCRKIGSLGDSGRHALDADGGQRALAALYAHAPPAAPVESPASVPDGWPAANDEQRELGWHWDYYWLEKLDDDANAAGWHCSMEAINHVLTKLTTPPTNQEGAAP